MKVKDLMTDIINTEVMPNIKEEIKNAVNQITKDNNEIYSDIVKSLATIVSQLNVLNSQLNTIFLTLNQRQNMEYYTSEMDKLNKLTRFKNVTF